MKTISIEKSVQDVNGLLVALKKHNPPFRALNVGTSAGRTYVYLADDEDKDPSPLVTEWTDPARLRIEGSKADENGVAVAWCDGKDLHRIRIRKVKSDDPDTTVPGNEVLHIIPSSMVHVSEYRPSLAGGQAEITVGPLTGPTEIDLVVIDPTNRLGKTSARLRFAPKPVEEPKQEGLLGRVWKSLGAPFRRKEEAPPAVVAESADELLPPPPPPPAPPDEDDE